jgi:hypothetical protein
VLEQQVTVGEYFEQVSRLSFSLQTHQHCSQENFNVTGNLDKNLLNVLFGNAIIFFLLKFI